VSPDNSRALHLELDLPLTGITGLADRVGIPSFSSPLCEADHRGNQSSHFEAHYASQVALRRLCADLHQNMYDYCKRSTRPTSQLSISIKSSSSLSYNDPPATNNSSDTPSASNDDYGGPEGGTLKQLASQLSQWRGMLPRDLQWAEDDPASFPTPQQADSVDFNQPLDPNLSSDPAQSRMPLFSTDLDKEPIQYPYVYDIQVALLRTRYYQVKYMVYRPFVYKALHFPEQMTREDAEGVAECLRVRHHFHFAWVHLKSCMLTMLAVMFEMAHHTLPNLLSETTSPLPILLVTEPPGHPPHNLPDTT
jgi:hypothetical protein